MAKMFYTMEEAKGALGRGEEEIKQLSRDGRLREFRDGSRLMFKADQVEQLKSELGAESGGSGGLDQVDLGVSDSGGLIGLVDTTGASGTSITLSDADTGQSSGAGVRYKDDTALAADLGLSGTMGGVPSPGGGGRGAGGGSGLSGSMSGRSGMGINVFGSEDIMERIDPSAQTAISGGIRDQIDLQGIGSGSGLLDLTRESDDTSLGAVLDEITPAGRRGPPIGGGASGMTGMGFEAPDAGFGSGMEESPTRPRAAAAPVYVTAADPLAPAFGGAALAAAGALIFGIFVLISSILGTRPEAVSWFKDKQLPLMVGMGLGGVALLFGVGLVFGLMMGGSRR